MGIKDVIYCAIRITNGIDTVLGFANNREEAQKIINDDKKYGRKHTIETSLIGTGLFSRSIIQ